MVRIPDHQNILIEPNYFTRLRSRLNSAWIAMTFPNYVVIGVDNGKTAAIIGCDHKRPLEQALKVLTAIVERNNKTRDGLRETLNDFIGRMRNGD